MKAADTNHDGLIEYHEFVPVISGLLMMPPHQATAVMSWGSGAARASDIGKISAEAAARKDNPEHVVRCKHCAACLIPYSIQFCGSCGEPQTEAASGAWFQGKMNGTALVSAAPLPSGNWFHGKPVSPPPPPEDTFNHLAQDERARIRQARAEDEIEISKQKGKTMSRTNSSLSNVSAANGKQGASASAGWFKGSVKSTDEHGQHAGDQYSEHDNASIQSAPVDEHRAAVGAQPAKLSLEDWESLCEEMYQHTVEAITGVPTHGGQATQNTDAKEEFYYSEDQADGKDQADGRRDTQQIQCSTDPEEMEAKVRNLVTCLLT